MEELEDSETVLAQFNRLVNELLRGALMRNCFRPWEIDLLLDLDRCSLRSSARKDILRRYQKSVQRQMERGATRPMKLSDYLESQRLRRGQVRYSDSDRPVEPDTGERDELWQRTAAGGPAGGEESILREVPAGDDRAG